MSTIGPWLQTHSGLAFDYLDPKPEQVDILDIARALARIPRFLGHTTGHLPYSVAQHSVHCCDLIQPIDVAMHMETARALKFAALLHDAHEAYVGDMPAPLKRLVPQFREIEKRAEAVVLEALGATLAMRAHRDTVKRTDLAMLATEQRDLMVKPPHPWIEMPPPFKLEIEPWQECRAELAFLDRYRMLRPR